MKIDYIKTLISVGISALIAYGFFSFHQSENSQLLVFTSWGELFLSSFFVLGLKFNLNRTTINVRTIATLFFIVFLLTNVVFSFMTFSKQLYIIINGIQFLTGILIVYSIIKVKQ